MEKKAYMMPRIEVVKVSMLTTVLTESTPLPTPPLGPSGVQKRWTEVF
jgi:hypothetical protein